MKQVCRSTTFFFSFCFIFALYADGFPKAKKKLVLIINKSEATTANLMAIKKLEEENTGSNWVDIRLIDMTEFKFDFKDPKFGTVEFELEQRLGDVLPNEYGSACVYYLVDGGVASMRHVSSLSSVEFRPSGGEIELFGYAKTDLVFKEIIDRIGKKVPTSIVVGSSFGQFVAKELASTYSLPSIASPGTEILSFSGENQDSIGNDFFYAIAGARLMGQFLESPTDPKTFMFFHLLLASASENTRSYSVVGKNNVFQESIVVPRADDRKATKLSSGEVENVYRVYCRRCLVEALLRS